MPTQRFNPERTESALRNPRFEIIPLRTAISEALSLPRGATITVTCSPSRGIDATLDLAETLAGRGYQVVPHLSARLVTSHTHLDRIVQRLDRAGIHRGFVIAGDSPRPSGPFESAGSLLSALDEASYPFQEIGISGYPEGHPLIDEDQLWDALAHKQQFADYLVTQMCFKADVILAWMIEVRRRGITLPFLVGIPGVVSPRQLLRIASKIGVGDSRRFLHMHRGSATRLIRPGKYSPDDLIDELTPYLGDPEYGIRGFHIYTFNEVRRTEAWWAGRLGAAV